MLVYFGSIQKSTKMVQKFVILRPGSIDSILLNSKKYTKFKLTEFRTHFDQFYGKQEKILRKWSF